MWEKGHTLWLLTRVKDLHLNTWFPFVCVNHMCLIWNMWGLLSSSGYEISGVFKLFLWVAWAFLDWSNLVELFAWPFNLFIWGVQIVNMVNQLWMTKCSLKLTNSFMWFLLVLNHGVLCRYTRCIRLLLSQICKLHTSKSSTSSIHLQDSRIPLTFWR